MVNHLAETIAAAGGPYKAGRTALRSRLAGLFRRTLREAGRLEANDPALERELVASDAFKAALDRLWPAVAPKALVRGILGSPDRLAEIGEGLLTADEVAAALGGPLVAHGEDGASTTCLSSTRPPSSSTAGPGPSAMWSSTRSRT